MAEDLKQQAITSIDGTLVLSDEYKEIFEQYNAPAYQYRTANELIQLGVYTDNFEGIDLENESYAFIDTPFEIANGYVKMMVKVTPVTYEGETRYNITPYGISAEPNTRQYGKYIINDLGLNFEENNFSLQEKILDSAESKLTDELFKRLNIPSEYVFFYNSAGMLATLPDILEKYRDAIWEDIPYVEFPTICEQKHYAEGDNYLLSTDNSLDGELILQNVSLKGDIPVSSAYNYYQSAAWLDNFLSTDVGFLQNLADGYNFIDIGYGEFFYDFSFLVIYMYKVPDGRFVTTTHSDGVKQSYGITYTASRQIAINNFSGNDPHADEWESSSSGGSITLGNYPMNWNHAHSLFRMSPMGYAGNARPYTINNQFPIKNTTLPENYPEMYGNPSIIGTPISIILDPYEPSPQKPTPIPPSIKVKTIPPVGYPPIKPIDIIPVIKTPVPPKSLPEGMGGIWHIQDSHLSALSEALWNDNIITQVVKAFGSNVMDCIVSCNEFMMDIPDTEPHRDSIGLGTWNSGVYAPHVKQRTVELNLGYVQVDEYFNDYRDYDNTTIEIYLPYIGIKQLDTKDCMNSNLEVTYTVDLLTGNAVCYVKVNRDGQKVRIASMFNCNVASQVPLTNLNNTGLINGMISLAGSTITHGVGGGIANAIGQSTQAHTSIEKSGDIGCNYGHLASKEPYIIITRPKPLDAVQYNKIIGYPSNFTTKLGNCKGYSEFREIQVDTIYKLTDNEREQLKELCANGILI